MGKRHTGVLGEESSGEAAPSGSHGQDASLIENECGCVGRTLLSAAFNLCFVYLDSCRTYDIKT